MFGPQSWEPDKGIRVVVAQMAVDGERFFEAVNAKQIDNGDGGGSGQCDIGQAG